MAQNHTRKSADDKPSKPYPGFPLFPHASGRWAKKIRGKLHYFGKWSDGWEKAEALYNQQREDLHAGRTPRATRDGLRLHELVNRYLDSKERQVAAGDLGKRSWQDYFITCTKLTAFIGRDRLVDDLAADDFGKFRLSLSKAGLGPVSIANEIRRTRGVFSWAWKNGIIDKPMRFGTEFAKPSARVLRLEKASKPTRLFTSEEIRRMLRAAPTTELECMILLGINAGLGNADIAELPIAAVDLDRGILEYPRNKTGVERRAMLWPETVKALRYVMANRPVPKDPADKDKVFITRCGENFVRFDGKVRIDAVHRVFAELLRGLGIKRKGVSFYSLRHSFRTACDGLDDRAANLVMGHTTRENDMPGNYTHGVPDERLKRVSDHVRAWLGEWQRTSEATEEKVE